MSEQAPSRPVVVEEIMDRADEYAYAAYRSVDFDYAVANKHLDPYRSALEAAITRLVGECDLATRRVSFIRDAVDEWSTGGIDGTPLYELIEGILAANGDQS